MGRDSLRGDEKISDVTEDEVSERRISIATRTLLFFFYLCYFFLCLLLRRRAHN